MLHLRDFREALGYTQEEVATLCGVVQSAVAHWEAGRVKPGPESQVRLLRVLGIDHDTAKTIPELGIPGPQRKPYTRRASEDRHPSNGHEVLRP